MGRTWDPTAPAIILACGMVAGVIAATGGLGPGQWRATLVASGSTVRFEMRLSERGSDWRVTTDVPAGELEGFDAAGFSRAGAPVRIAWKRDPGSFVFEGAGGRRPAGVVRFEPSAGFREAWSGLGLGPLADSDLVTMAFSGVGLAEVRQLKASGVADLDVRGVIELASDPDAMRWVEELQGRGVPPSLRDVFLLRNHGLRPEIYHEYQRSGVAAGVQEIVLLHDRGISPDYLAGIASSGLEGAGVDGTVRLHDQGVDVDYVRGVIGSALSGITIEGIVRLHAHGVPVDYVRAVAEYGPGDRAVDDAIRLHDIGVSTEFMRAGAGTGTTRPTTEGTIRSWTRGARE